MDIINILVAILLFICYVALFVAMIIAASIHSWFAFVGWFLAWLFVTIWIIWVKSSS